MAFHLSLDINFSLHLAGNGYREISTRRQVVRDWSWYKRNTKMVNRAKTQLGIPLTEIFFILLVSVLIHSALSQDPLTVTSRRKEWELEKMNPVSRVPSIFLGKLRRWKDASPRVDGEYAHNMHIIFMQRS